ncbi:MAG: helix-hairpin-helix domain-containing protein [Anaerolineaceae bacterium]|nr:helix-hairpin-helix domain-containing protein [Anaerolineaceae bacterium]
MNKPWLLILSGLLIGLLAAGLILLIAQPRQGVPITLLPAPTATATDLPQPTRTPEPIVVQIGGAIHSPGVYSLNAGTRLEDLIFVAGDLTSEADLDRINVALKLQDGKYYYLPVMGEDIPETAANAPGYVASDGGFNYPLNLNTATQEELESLPGIGPSKAADILTYREQHGPFATLDDLANVTGIGDATVESLRDYLIVEQP